MKTNSMLVLALILSPAVVCAQVKENVGDELKELVKQAVMAKPSLPASAAVTKQPYEAVVHGGYVYVPVSGIPSAALTQTGSSGTTALINGTRVAPLAQQLKTQDGVIVVVTETGASSEALMTKDDIAALLALGAPLDKNGFPPSRAFLKFKLLAPVDHVDIEVQGAKPYAYKLSTIL